MPRKVAKEQWDARAKAGVAPMVSTLYHRFAFATCADGRP